VDLAYLPHVESSFNPKAYSKFGAAGMWQFTRSTGKQYMTVSYAVDERRDPILSSRAAARLLKRNFKKFQNWPMAITAYKV
jgi:membrane-bound lytic murein transglycosylase D